MVTEAEDAGGSVCIVMRSLWNLDKIQAEETVYSKIRRRHNIYIYLFIYLIIFIYLCIYL